MNTANNEHSEPHKSIYDAHKEMLDQYLARVEAHKEAVIQQMNAFYAQNWRAQAESVLLRARMYVLLAHDKAEANHDNIDGDLYMDSVQYEIMKKTDALIAEIDTLIQGVSQNER